MLLEVLRDAGDLVAWICTALVQICTFFQLSVRSVPRVGSLSEIHDPLNGSFQHSSANHLNKAMKGFFCAEGFS